MVRGSRQKQEKTVAYGEAVNNQQVKGYGKNEKEKLRMVNIPVEDHKKKDIYVFPYRVTSSSVREQ